MGFIDTSEKNYVIDTCKIKYFSSFIKNCAKAKVELYIFVSPGFIKYTKKEISVLKVDMPLQVCQMV